jgi:hypothetical protein
MCSEVSVNTASKIISKVLEGSLTRTTIMPVLFSRIMNYDEAINPKIVRRMDAIVSTNSSSVDPSRTAMES